jgi:hypothetical protein
MLIFIDQRKKRKENMENLSDLMAQARHFLSQNPTFLPLDHVEEVAWYGTVDVYVMAHGVDINTPEGSHTLNWEAALYLVCRNLCDLGVGNRPFIPHPYVRDPVLIEEAEGAAGDVGAADQPGEDVPHPAMADHPPEPADEGVLIQGPFIWPGLDQPPIVPAPDVAQPVQPPHGAVCEPLQEDKPKPETKPKLEPDNLEYIEPLDLSLGEFK